MAKKIDNVKASAPEATAGADDLEVLHPDRTLRIGGREITVREYGFVEGLKLRKMAQPFTDAIYQQLNSGGKVFFDQALGLIADHYELVLDLVAISADVDRSFLDTLSDEEGHSLLMHWWGANGPFYIRSAVRRVQVERTEAVAIEAVRAKLHAGQTSTPPLSPTDTRPAPSEPTLSAS